MLTTVLTVFCNFIYCKDFSKSVTDEYSVIIWKKTIVQQSMQQNNNNYNNSNLIYKVSNNFTCN